MSTQPIEPEPVDYPPDWKPAEVRRRDEREANSAKVENYLRNLCGIELAQLLARVRGGDR